MFLAWSGEALASMRASRPGARVALGAQPAKDTSIAASADPIACGAKETGKRAATGSEATTAAPDPGPCRGLTTGPGVGAGDPLSSASNRRAASPEGARAPGEGDAVPDEGGGDNGPMRELPCIAILGIADDSDRISTARSGASFVAARAPAAPKPAPPAAAPGLPQRPRR